MKNLLFQADFIACNPPLSRNFFSTRFRRWFDLMMIFAHTFLCNANKLSTGFTIWPHSFDSNPNNILTSLFFLKNSSKRLLSAQLRVKISNFHREFHNLSGTFSNSVLDLQICPRDRNCTTARSSIMTAMSVFCICKRKNSNS